MINGARCCIRWSHSSLHAKPKEVRWCGWCIPKAQCCLGGPEELRMVPHTARSRRRGEYWATIEQASIVMLFCHFVGWYEVNRGMANPKGICLLQTRHGLQLRRVRSVVRFSERQQRLCSWTSTKSLTVRRWTAEVSSKSRSSQPLT